MNKWLSFKLIDHLPKTEIWQVENNLSGEIIGHVKWYPQWRQYTFLPKNDTGYFASCLIQISEFIEQKMKRRQ